VTFIKIRSHRRKFSNSDSVEQKTILRVLTRAQETGKVLPNRNEIGGGARTARTLANEEAILNIVEEDGTRSIRKIAQELEISSRSVHRVLKQNILSTVLVCNTLNKKITLFEEIVVFSCLIKLQKMKILLRGSCFRTNQVSVR
jgi:predicted HTH transcriptional regulator